MRRLVLLVAVLILLAVALLVHAGSGQAQQASCEPSYPDLCIPPPPPDLDCPQIEHRDFTVLMPDPHGFDGNLDGIGCESAEFGPGGSAQATATPGAGQPAPTQPAASVPDAGSGPSATQGIGVTALVMAGLAGAGIAWLTAGTAALRFARRAGAGFVPRLRPTGRRHPFERRD